MFSVKHRNVSWETIKAFFKYEVVTWIDSDKFIGIVWHFSKPISLRSGNELGGKINQPGDG